MSSGMLAISLQWQWIGLFKSCRFVAAGDCHQPFACPAPTNTTCLHSAYKACCVFMTCSLSSCLAEHDISLSQSGQVCAEASCLQLRPDQGKRWQSRHGHGHLQALSEQVEVHAYMLSSSLGYCRCCLASGSASAQLGTQASHCCRRLTPKDCSLLAGAA